MNWLNKSKDINRIAYEEGEVPDPIEEASEEEDPQSASLLLEQILSLLKQIKEGQIPKSVWDILHEGYNKAKEAGEVTIPEEEFSNKYIDNLIQYLQSSVPKLKQGQIPQNLMSILF